MAPEPMAFMKTAAAPAAGFMDKADGAETAATNTKEEKIKLRSFFPENWLFSLDQIGDNDLVR